MDRWTCCFLLDRINGTYTSHGSPEPADNAARSPNLGPAKGGSCLKAKSQTCNNRLGDSLVAVKEKNVGLYIRAIS